MTNEEMLKKMETVILRLDVLESNRLAEYMARSEKEEC